GSFAIGAYLWLGLNGELALPRTYHSLRALHAGLQLHFFLGAFIVGFLSQGAPRILESHSQVRPQAKYLFPLLAFALLIRVLGFMTVADTLTFLVYAGALFCLFPVFLTANPENRLRMAMPCAVSLAALALGALVDTSDAGVALAVFWWGVV